MLNSRKDTPIAPSIKMKQLQWDKLPQPLVGKTLWNEEAADREKQWVSILQTENVWKEMEEDFKAKQLAINLMGMIVDLASNTLDLTPISSETKTGRTQERSGPFHQEACRFVNMGSASAID